MLDYTVMVRIGGKECVWGDLPNKVHTNIARRSVTVVSFSGDKMFFACTGLLISWHERRRTRVGTRTRMHARSVILTSASLARACNDEDEVDGNLRIEVFLAPRQRANGTLELYHLDYNIAIISVDKQFVAARPEDIFNTVEKPSKVVVAIGREYEEGALFAALGKVTNKPRSKPSELDCKDLKAVHL
ncbi:uncharacterized protein LOC100833930 [Brachypodium distachyon]|uniref:uncharacterized protein LOC100833930 n=1 Tax=Brachypodium distachyon TaxID=15368 RepID=UPI000530052C|nr:uncharacterized protein LOC100833930 [Brachypodium distachyon]|eukprot:XP_024318773.1 uncharacterized protein LOC100833930 [Brachypodium distachyon]